MLTDSEYKTAVGTTNTWEEDFVRPNTTSALNSQTEHTSTI